MFSGEGPKPPPPKPPSGLPPRPAGSRRGASNGGAFGATVAGVQCHLAGTGATPAMAFGVYVHIPFCRRRCDYCAFATWTDRSHLMEAYAAACQAELRSAALPAATSVFFGGG